MVGESPVTMGADNNRLVWVDILGQRVLWRNLQADESGSWDVGEDVSFAVPRKSGGLVIGTASGPVIFHENGHREPLPTRLDADGVEDPMPIRWNDAKVAPNGDLWLGSMAYGGKHKVGGLYRLDGDEKRLTRVLSEVQVSNGLAWSLDEKTFYFIDSPTQGIDAFDYFEGSISRRRRVWSDDRDTNVVPDGMAMDTEGGLWVAFWNGSCVRRLDSEFRVSEEIRFPNKFITSCAFAGPDLKTLVITTARGEPGSLDQHPLAGMTYMAKPGVSGCPPVQFGE